MDKSASGQSADFLFEKIENILNNLKAGSSKASLHNHPVERKPPAPRAKTFLSSEDRQAILKQAAEARERAVELQKIIAQKFN